MRDFSAAIGPVFAIEGRLKAGVIETTRSRMAPTPRLRGVGIIDAARRFG